MKDKWVNIYYPNWMNPPDDLYNCQPLVRIIQRMEEKLSESVFEQIFEIIPYDPVISKQKYISEEDYEYVKKFGNPEKMLSKAFILYRMGVNFEYLLNNGIRSLFSLSKFFNRKPDMSNPDTVIYFR